MYSVSKDRTLVSVGVSDVDDEGPKPRIIPSIKPVQETFLAVRDGHFKSMAFEMVHMLFLDIGNDQGRIQKVIRRAKRMG